MDKQRCSLCKIYKPFSEFNKHVGLPNGLDSWCRSCSQRKAKERYKRNKEIIREQRKASYQKHKESRSEWHKKYYQQNKEGIKTKVKEWQRKHADRIYERTKEYRKTNPQKRKAHYAIGNAIRRKKLPPASDFKCVICKIKQALDYHHYLGYAPEHYFDVQPLCRECHKKVG